MYNIIEELQENIDELKVANEFYAKENERLNAQNIKLREHLKTLCKLIHTANVCDSDIVLQFIIDNAEDLEEFAEEIEELLNDE